MVDQTLRPGRNQSSAMGGPEPPAEARSMSVIVIRNAAPDDAATIVRVMIETKQASTIGPLDPHDLDADFWLERWRVYIAAGSKAQYAKGDGSCIIATIDGNGVGFAAWHHTSRWDCDAELQSIYVLPHAQRRGIGTRLFETVLGRLQADGSRSLCVGYAPDNPYKRFYAKHGAVEIEPHWAVWRSLRSI